MIVKYTYEQVSKNRRVVSAESGNTLIAVVYSFKNFGSQQNRKLKSYSRFLRSTKKFLIIKTEYSGDYR